MKVVEPSLGGGGEVAWEGTVDGVPSTADFTAQVQVDETVSIVVGHFTQVLRTNKGWGKSSRFLQCKNTQCMFFSKKNVQNTA
jgi:hypothetical protein